MYCGTPSICSVSYCTASAHTASVFEPVSSVSQMAAADGSSGANAGRVDKICRACTDFKTWMKQLHKTNDNTKVFSLVTFQNLSAYKICEEIMNDI